MADDELRALNGRTFRHMLTGGVRIVTGIEELPDRTGAVRVYGVLWRHPSEKSSHNRSRRSIFERWMRTAIEIPAPRLV